MPAANNAILDAIYNNAIAQGLDPQLALEVAIQESGLNPGAVSSAGAIGLYQLMPDTAAGLGVDPTDISQNIAGGQSYLSQMLSQFGGDISAALAAYNWGPGNVQNAMNEYGAGWLSYAPAETQNYVASITGNLGSQYSSNAGDLTAAVDSAAGAVTGFFVNDDGSTNWTNVALVAGVGVTIIWLIF